MRTIAIAAAKGGAGKTTLATTLAAQAAGEGERVAMLDLNSDQASLTHWWALRGEPANPHVVRDRASVTASAARLRPSGWDWLILDCPPLEYALLEAAVCVADVVLIPVRPSGFEMLAVDATAEICRRKSTPFAFVLSAVDQRFKRINAQSRGELSELGTVLEASLSYRLAYLAAPADGKAGFEIEKDLCGESLALWQEVESFALSGCAGEAA
ncbi:MAG: AAA family ATPase [Pseudomonadota bacterium]